MKKVLSVILAFLMMATGIVVGTREKQEVYAKTAEASEDMLQVKVQIATDSSKTMRFITSVDSLDYKRVGFELDTPEDPMDEPLKWDTKTVFERIVSTEENVKYEFSPKVVSTEAAFFATGKLKAEAGTLYTVRAYVETLDGQIIYGPSRCVATEDADNHLMNLSIAGNLSSDKNYTATYNGKQAEAVMVLPSENGISNIRVLLPEEDSVTNLPSATKVIISEGSTEVASAIYRNFYSTYGTESRGDTSWYTVDPSANEFVIASNADLWGLATLVNAGTELFKGDKVVLVRDVKVNEGKLTVAGTGTKVEDYDWSGDMTNWPKIGVSASNHFNGTFDGDGNTISGVYANYYSPAGNHTGLFGYIGTSALLKNFTLKNSLIDADYNTGAVVGVCKGSLENIYVDTDVCAKMRDAADYQAGGFIGIVDNNGGNMHIRNCWFAGVVANNGFRTGGFIARVYQGSMTMENCLVTGKVISTKTGNDPKVGGFIGGVDTKGSLTMSNCLGTGEIYAASKDTVGGIVGRVQADLNVAFKNVYTTNQRACDGDFAAAFTASTYDGIGSNSAVSLKGLGFVLTEEQLTNKNGYLNTAFDFVDKYNEEGPWVATANGPELKAFSTETPITEFDSYRTTLGWYYKEYVNGKVPTTATTYEIDNADDLFGLAQLVNNKTDVFAGDTVTLTKDIDVNPGWVASATLLEGGRTWNPMGTNYGDGSAFKGTFDGAKHTISGIYVNANAQNTGLFGDLGGVAKNFVLSNSYIKNEATLTGAIAGRLSIGRIENVFIDKTVTVKTTNTKDGVIGGVVGRMGYNDSNRADRISNVRFDGTVIGTTIVGGILGQTWYTSADKIILDHCMFNGIIETTDYKVGGLIGHNDDASTIQYCLSIGTIRTPYKTHLGMVVGQKAKEVTAVDCYGIKNLYTVDGATARDDVHADKYTAVTEAALRSDARATVPELFNTSKTTSWAVDTNGMPTLKWMTE